LTATGTACAGKGGKGGGGAGEEDTVDKTNARGWRRGWDGQITLAGRAVNLQAGIARFGLNVLVTTWDMRT
jgi:hypothetical protein